jgi:lipopolysaccharide transport system ATP-binding protein
MSFEQWTPKEHMHQNSSPDKAVEKEVVISVRNLSKYYRIYNSPISKVKELLVLGRRPFHRKFWALGDVSFDVLKGECAGIIGINGSGKSTLLQSICGTLCPTSGIIKVQGRVSALLELGSGFNPEFTGKENVYMNAAILGLSNDEIDTRYPEIVDFADIGDFIDQPVKKYSRGMFVRLAFAVAINVDPEILLVDEALAVGDAFFQSKCYERLDLLKRNGTTILLVSHDMNAIKTLCSKVFFLHKGNLRAEGLPSDIVEQYYFKVRSNQQRSGGSYSLVTRKSSVGQPENFAFGTDQGRVIKAAFVDFKTYKAVLKTGDIVHIRVEVEYQGAIVSPALSMIIQDRRSIEIGGTYTYLSAPIQENGLCRAQVEFIFKANLAKGEYFITIRLEDRRSEVNFFPIDKQVGALFLKVLSDPQRCLLGIFDFQIEHHQTKITEES